MNIESFESKSIKKNTEGEKMNIESFESKSIKKNTGGEKMKKEIEKKSILEELLMYGKKVNKILMNYFLKIISVFSFILKIDLARALKFSLPILFIIASINMIIAGNIVVKNGILNATGTENNYFEGKIGIGTTNPQAKLDINSGNVFLDQGYGVFYNNGQWGWRPYNSAGKMSFYTNNAEVVSILSLGNVGIGTTSPTEKLEVNGNIKASGTICDSNGCIGSGNGGGCSLGDWQDTDIGQVGGTGASLIIGTVYQAKTDGFVVFPEKGSGGNSYIFYTDSSNPPTTKRQDGLDAWSDGSGWRAVPSMSIVRKNDYWKLTGEAGKKIYWIPLEGGGGGGVINATEGLIIELRTSDPATPHTGQIWLRIDI